MRIILFTLLLLGTFNQVQAQSPDSLGTDSSSMSMGAMSMSTAQTNAILQIIDLQAYIIPLDSVACSQAFATSHPDSALHKLLACPVRLSPSSVEILVQVASPEIIDRLYLRAGRTLGATQHLNHNTAFTSISTPPSGMTISLLNSNTLSFKVDLIRRPMPFYLEAWLTDANGVSSPVRTISIVQPD